METDMKNCVVCGERIPQSAQYCEKCGSGQPTVAEDKRKDAETTTLKQPHHQKKELTDVVVLVATSYLCASHCL
ncbi:hypothetical protein P4G59_10870 [Lactiplantibacillus plantarum]|uniref:hypothetical protein n=1 Tax=Lactiplantibacillus plantarum TaxID=1590 RepID=UPI0021A9FC11|nr:hypothetical protein [Lactiplantibacillus plantarum]MDP4437010.1 hypothetical protein [Lactiplantibacillus plantarum]MDP4440139.1 hypothetical protein [Lactiplantibacillus plantarum]MDP4458651.1 hypothetical protein [Lactiplantibacillus plantarum]